MQSDSPAKSTTIIYWHYGDPDVLTAVERDLPQPEAGQVRVRVHAASVNPFDVKMRRGDLASYFPVQFPVAPGADAAGTVDAVGAGVKGIALGDEVLGAAAAGSYAQYALLGAPVAKPASVSWETAASLPTVGQAAFRALKQLELQAGETLLIHGAAGSVGAIATQLAVARGIHVIGSVGASDEDEARALGAEPVRYGDGLAERVRAFSPRGVDAVLDASGGGVLPVSIELAGGPDRVLTLVDGNASQYGVRFSDGGDDSAPEALGELAPLAASGKLKLRIWRTYPLLEAASAHADIEARRNHGKIVLLP
jgi:NADPH:quinone reductase-like Zn-dependent oxidoreductase